MRAHDPPSPARPAFSLVELLVVLAVIATLVALALPALGSSRRAAAGVACLASLRSIGQAVVMYADASKDRYPASSHTAGSLLSPSAWLTSLQDYGVTPANRLCPLDPDRRQRFTSYATNEHFEPLSPGIDFSAITGQPLPRGRRRAFTHQRSVPRPAATIYSYEPESGPAAGTVDHLVTHWFAVAADVERGIAVRRHLGSAHYLFADGHARAWAWAEFSARFSPTTSPFDPETAR